MDMKEVLIRNYMPYAKGTIISRAIPAIDGMKPANRRILYAMFENGLLNSDKRKSSNIAGQVMTWHPHGDGSIYDTMVRMTESNESLNAPYISGKGNFGKVWSQSTAYAASRYTEAGLAKICNEIFDGIRENAVDMVPNFDNTVLEPKLLPVKFPTVLVNTSYGIAVGYSSNIAPFGLKEVCEATSGVMQGKINTVEELMEVLGAPEFPTGGFIHVDKNELMKLGQTGRGTFTVSGAVQVYQDRIIVREIPYKTSVEAIVDDIRNLMKTELKEVSSVKDLSDIKGLNIQILLRRGANPRKVLKKINRYTKLRMQMSFNNTVIINNRCVTLGVWDIIQEWIKFRMETVRRLYEFRADKKSKQVHLLEAWEKVKDDITGVVEILTKHSEEEAKQLLHDKFDLDDEQAEYFLDIKVRLITKNRMAGKLAELENARAELQRFTSVATNESVRSALICTELDEIGKKYGHDRKCLLADPIVEEVTEEDESKIDDSAVTIILTEKGYLKKLVSLRDYSDFTDNPNDPTAWKVQMRNNEHLLVFTYSGVCYKILADDIETYRGYPKQYIYSLADKFDDSEIMFVTGSGDYSGSFNVIYASGKGHKVYLERVSGKRARYRSIFEPGDRTNMWCTTEDKFFIITKHRNAAFADVGLMSQIGRQSSFRVGRIMKGDEMFGVQPASRVPDFDTIDLERYSKAYCVKIRDALWEGAREQKEKQAEQKEKEEMLRKADESMNNILKGDTNK